MVDYDIIRVLKDNIGYKSWEEVGQDNMKKCFRDYNSDNFENLSLWGIEQERYWALISKVEINVDYGGDTIAFMRYFKNGN